MLTITYKIEIKLWFRVASVPNCCKALQNYLIEITKIEKHPSAFLW